MKVLTIGAALVAATLAGSAMAQAPAPAAPKLFASAAELQALIVGAKAKATPGTPLVAQPVTRFAPYTANLEYRTGDAPPAVHEKDVELFWVIEGGGTFTTGGKLAGETRVNDANLRGTAIEGGESRKVGKGDSFIVPPGTPHGFTAIEGGALVMISLHVPSAGWPK